MMTRVRDKLRDCGGVTILMALFALLVAAMVSAVILGAAVTTVKQAKTEQVQQQDALTLQSAGDVIADNITASTVWQHYTVTESFDKDGKSEGSGDPSYGDCAASDKCIVGTELASYVQAALKATRESSHYSEGFDFTIDASASDGSGYASTVNVHCQVNGTRQNPSSFFNDDQLVFTLELRDEADNVQQTMYLKIDYKAKDTEWLGSSRDYAEDKSYTETARYRIPYKFENPYFYLAAGVTE